MARKINLILLLVLAFGFSGYGQDLVVLEENRVDKNTAQLSSGLNEISPQKGRTIANSDLNDSNLLELKIPKGIAQPKVHPIEHKKLPESLKLAKHVDTSSILLKQPPLYRPDRHTQGAIITNEEILKMPF